MRTNRFATYHPYYQEIPKIIESVYNSFVYYPLSKQILPLGISSDSIVKIIKPIYNMSKASLNHFAIYCLHYKNIFVSNLTQIYICITNSLYFLGLVTKEKKEPPRVVLSLLSNTLWLLSFMLSLMLSKSTTIFEYATISIWHIN